MRIITISREFGSGGRELGKRLADFIGATYYDKEILSAISERFSENENNIELTLSKGGFSAIPLSFSNTLSHVSNINMSESYHLARYHRIMKDIATIGDAVIVGLGADVILREHNPYSIYVYSDITSKVERCRARAHGEEKNMTDKEWVRKIKYVDKERANHYAMIASTPWGDMHNYNLCIDTSGSNLADIVPIIAELSKMKINEE